MKETRWFKVVVSVVGIILVICAVSVKIIDPDFHYGAPHEKISYKYGKERYINDGIIKNFPYNAVITGTSMTENFKTSEFNELWDVQSIKIPFSAASFREINENLEKVFRTQNDVKYVLRCLDSSKILEEKDLMRYDEAIYPTYLYDENIWNDVNYLLNKEALLYVGNDILSTVRGDVEDDFDTYANWESSAHYGREEVLKSYEREDKLKGEGRLTEEECGIIEENLEQNVTRLIGEQPDTIFYLYLSPYSICYWDSLYRQGNIEKQIQIQEYTIKKLLEYDNIRLFSFDDNFELICNLDHYKDIAHYDGKTNSDILNWMAEGKYQITKENFQQYINNIRAFYTTYDYDSLFWE